MASNTYLFSQCGLVFLAAPCSSMAYHHDSRRIFVGQDNGAIMVGSFSDIFSMSFVRPPHVYLC